MTITLIYPLVVKDEEDQENYASTSAPTQT